MANAIGVYDTTCHKCGEEIWIIPLDDGIHVTYPDEHHDVLLPLQETKKPSIKYMAWQLYQAAFEAGGAWLKAHPEAAIFDPEYMRLVKQSEACRNAWLACGGTEQIIIGIPEGAS
jgi:hypothetical protein